MYNVFRKNWRLLNASSRIFGTTTASTIDRIDGPSSSAAGVLLARDGGGWPESTTICVTWRCFLSFLASILLANSNSPSSLAMGTSTGGGSISSDSMSETESGVASLIDFWVDVDIFNFPVFFFKSTCY